MNRSRSNFYKVKRMCRIALIAALMVAVKEPLAWLPNGEVVSTMVCVGTLVFGTDMLITTVVFSMIEILIYGFGLWTIMYLYVWNVLVILCLVFKPVFRESRLAWSVLMSIYGLSFGALCAIPYLFIGGLAMAIPWWVSGLSFDLMHCGWNFVFGMVTFYPLLRIFKKGKQIESNGISD